MNITCCKYTYVFMKLLLDLLAVSLAFCSGSICLRKGLPGSLKDIFVAFVKYIYIYIFVCARACVTGRVCINTCAYSKCHLYYVIVTNTGSRSRTFSTANKPQNKTLSYFLPPLIFTTDVPKTHRMRTFLSPSVSSKGTFSKKCLHQNSILNSVPSF
jgi:hypothetical protein